MRKHKFLRVLMFLPLVVLFVALFGFVVMWFWNSLMPALFGLKQIGYWQGLGLFVLSKILFGGFRGGAGGRSWRLHRMMEGCERMTPEEREKFRQAFYSRWGRVESPESNPSA